MSEGWLIFFATVFLTILLALFAAWSTFYSSNKYSEAKKTIVAGFLFVIICTFLLAWFLGSINKLTQELLHIILLPLNLFTLVVWTIVIFILPRFIKSVIQKLLTLKSTKIVASKRTITSKKNQKIIFKDLLTTDLTKWQIITGKPEISHIRGKEYLSSLMLDESPADRRHSFIIANQTKIKNGRIECDLYLERGALVNITFRGSSNLKTFYMARIDSRSGASSGFLYSQDYVNWDYIKVPKIVVQPDQWYHVELIFIDKRFSLKIGNANMINITDEKISGSGFVGIFNEVKRAFVNNFTIAKIS